MRAYVVGPVESAGQHRGRVVDDHPEPEPGPGDALIAVRLAGICGTDLELLDGYADFEGVPGHEFVGDVLACPSRPELVGQRVVGEVNVTCGSCSACRGARKNHCPWRVALGIRGLDGAFAERLVLPAANLHVVPGRVTDEQAVFIEPLAAALRVLEQATLYDGDRAVVVGDGRLGLLVARALAAAGSRVTVLGRHEGKLARVRSPEIRTVTTAAEITVPAGLVVEATGHASGLETALDLVRPMGAIVLKSTCAGDTSRSVDWNRVVVDEIRIVGSRCGPFATALTQLEEGRVVVTDLIDAAYPLADIDDALDHAAERGVMKVLVRVGRA